MAWIRSGYCCRCGDCCRGSPHHPDNPLVASEAMSQPAMVDGYCPLFRWHALGVGFCTGHIGAVPAGKEDPYYLAACSSWPDHPEQLKDKPRCTYTFEWADGD
jgi:hypothetical protein